MRPSKQPDEFRKRGIRTLAQGYIDNGHFASIEWLIKQHGEVIDAGFALAGWNVAVVFARPAPLPNLLNDQADRGGGGRHPDGAFSPAPLYATRQHSS